MLIRICMYCALRNSKHNVRISRVIEIYVFGKQLFRKCICLTSTYYLYNFCLQTAVCNMLMGNKIMFLIKILQSLGVIKISYKNVVIFKSFIYYILMLATC